MKLVSNKKIVAVNADGRWVENGYETISRYCDFRCSCENNKFSCGDFKCEDNHECIPTDERSDFGFCRKITLFFCEFSSLSKDHFQFLSMSCHTDSEWITY